MTHYLDDAVEAAKIGGKVLKEYWGKVSDIRVKSAVGDLVTEADQCSEDAILAFIKERYPDHEILSEEAGVHKTESSEYIWHIDPLDGTTNYTHSYPFVAVSIALLHHRKPIIGVVYNPILEEIFCGEIGKGATFNDEPLAVSKTSSLQDSLLATGFAYDRHENPDNNYLEFCRLTQLTHGVRRAGSAALDLAYVAAGKLDGFWESGLQPWDMSAGYVLIKEAGGKVTGYEGKPFDPYRPRIIAGNPKVHSLLNQEIEEIRS